MAAYHKIMKMSLLTTNQTRSNPSYTNSGYPYLRSHKDLENVEMKLVSSLSKLLLLATETPEPDSHNGLSLAT